MGKRRAGHYGSRIGRLPEAPKPPKLDRARLDYWQYSDDRWEGECRVGDKKIFPFDIIEEIIAYLGGASNFRNPLHNLIDVRLNVPNFQSNPLYGRTLLSHEGLRQHYENTIDSDMQKLTEKDVVLELFSFIGKNSRVIYRSYPELKDQNGISVRHHFRMFFHGIEYHSRSKEGSGLPLSLENIFGSLNADLSNFLATLDRGVGRRYNAIMLMDITFIITTILVYFYFWNQVFVVLSGLGLLDACKILVDVWNDKVEVNYQKRGFSWDPRYNKVIFMLDVLDKVGMPGFFIGLLAIGVFLLCYPLFRKIPIIETRISALLETYNVDSVSFFKDIVKAQDFNPRVFKKIMMDDMGLSAALAEEFTRNILCLRKYLAQSTNGHKIEFIPEIW